MKLILLPIFAARLFAGDFRLTCENLRPWPGTEPAPGCQTREFNTVYRGGTFNINAEGAVRVRGWERDTIAVLARYEVFGSGNAQEELSGIAIELTSGGVSAVGPRAPGAAWWQVSFDILVPQSAALELAVNNGMVDLADLRGSVVLNVNNGAIQVQRCDGAQIRGSTRNGFLSVGGAVGDLALSTGNGQLRLDLPREFQGEFQVNRNWGALRVSDEFLRIAGLVVSERGDKHFAGRLGAGDRGRIVLSSNNGGADVGVLAGR